MRIEPMLKRRKGTLILLAIKLENSKIFQKESLDLFYKNKNSLLIFLKKLIIE